MEHRLSFYSLQTICFNFATTATKKITESVAETAQTIKKSVEEGKIDDIIDKVHLNIFWKYKFMKFISS